MSGDANNLFRKKPVVVEAVQFTEAVRDALLFDGKQPPGGVRVTSASTHPPTRRVWNATFCIRTLEGDMEVKVGDWIIKGVQGEFYPCKPDIFAATYEPATLRAESAEVEVVACKECGDSRIEFNYNGDGPFPCRCCTQPADQPAAQVDDAADWRIGMFERWNQLAKELGYAGIAEALAALEVAQGGPK